MSTNFFPFQPPRGVLKVNITYCILRGGGDVTRCPEVERHLPQVSPVISPGCSKLLTGRLLSKKKTCNIPSPNANKILGIIIITCRTRVCIS